MGSGRPWRGVWILSNFKEQPSEIFDKVVIRSDLHFKKKIILAIIWRMDYRENGR